MLAVQLLSLPCYLVIYRGKKSNVSANKVLEQKLIIITETEMGSFLLWLLHLHMVLNSNELHRSYIIPYFPYSIYSYSYDSCKTAQHMHMLLQNRNRKMLIIKCNLFFPFNMRYFSRKRERDKRSD